MQLFHGNPFLISHPGKFIANEKHATVSWEDSQAFIKGLNEIEGYNRYRLPTEPNGNMLAVQERTPRIHSATTLDSLDIMRGMEKILTLVRFIPWGKKNQTRGVYTICTEMYGNGGKIGTPMIIILKGRILIPKGQNTVQRR